MRRKTDALDAAGNTTAAIGKGYAIGSAALVALALYGAFVTRIRVASQYVALMSTEGNQGSYEPLVVSILQPLTFAFLLFGAAMPYWFSAMTMRSVGEVNYLALIRENLNAWQMFHNNFPINRQRCK